MNPFVGLVMMLLLIGLVTGSRYALGPGYSEALLIFAALGISVRQLLSDR